MLRIYCKVWRSCGLWWDDLVLIISWVRLLVLITLSSLWMLINPRGDASSSSSSWRCHHWSHDRNGDAFKGKQPVVRSDAAVAEAVAGTGDNSNNTANNSDNNAPSPIVPCGPTSLTGGAGRVKGEKTATEKWGTYWKFEKGAFNATKPLTNKSVARANTTVDGLADDSSERVLVLEGTGSSDGQGEGEAASRLRTGG
jgi:hypothetical protein